MLCKCCGKNNSIVAVGLCSRCYYQFYGNKVAITDENIEKYSKFFRLSDESKIRKLTYDECKVIYDFVRNRYIKNFPNGFWKVEYADSNLENILRYLYLELNNISKDKVVTMKNTSFISNNKLASIIYSKDYFDILSRIYGIEKHQFMFLNKRYWSDEKNCKRSLEYFLETIGCETREDVIEALNDNNLRDAHLYSLSKKYKTLESRLKLLGIE